MSRIGEQGPFLLVVILYICSVNGRSTKCEYLIKEKLQSYYEDKVNNHLSIKENLAHGNPDQSKCQYLEKELGGICSSSTYGCGHTNGTTRKRTPHNSPHLNNKRLVNGNGGRTANPNSSKTLTHQKRAYHSNIYLEYSCLPRFDCSSASSDLYRTYDGSCNNLNQYGWEWGSADRIQSGFLWADYDDYVGTPRTEGGYLPNPRLVSQMVHTATVPQEDDPERSLFCMQFGQLLAHDMVLTEQFKHPNGSSLDCCGADSNHAECFPIFVGQNDGHFSAGECFNLVRSKARLNCDNGVQEQVNEQTAFLDLSMVYGVSVAEANNLRTMIGGLLKTVQNKLPKGPDELCDLSRPSDEDTYYCTLAGDPRSDEQPGLASVHTIWTREHNRLANLLSTRHPSWTDEKLFQEARKINIAEWQHIVYNEYLPVTIGLAAMQAENININEAGYKNTYNSLLDPTIRNAFGAAIFRFGHTLISDKIALADVSDETILNEQDLKLHFFEPDLYHSNANGAADNILKWTADTPCLLSDRKLQASIQKFLFLDALGKSADLAALNIQRGRDHGIPSYNEYRTYCNLPRAQYFGVDTYGFVDHEQEVVNLLASAYQYPDDVDLFTGYISEKRLPGSQLGPTGQCLFVEQFKALRDGDRFFYERNDPQIGFTIDQLLQIKQVRMSTVFCLNTAVQAGKRVQQNMFLQEKAGNPFIDCSNEQGIDLSYW